MLQIKKETANIWECQVVNNVCEKPEWSPFDTDKQANYHKR